MDGHMPGEERSTFMAELAEDELLLLSLAAISPLSDYRLRYLVELPDGSLASLDPAGEQLCVFGERARAELLSAQLIKRTSKVHSSGTIVTLTQRGQEAVDVWRQHCASYR
jgi:hypothetical protein